MAVELATKDALRLLAAAHRLAACERLTDLPEVATRAARTVVRCDYATYNELDVARRRAVTWIDDQTVARRASAARQAFTVHFPDHPVLRRRIGDGGPFVDRLSDHVSPRRHRQTGLYREVLRPLDVEHQIILGLRASDHGPIGEAASAPGAGVRIGVALNRGGGASDFDDSDRLRLCLLLPHLVSAYRRLADAHDTGGRARSPRRVEALASLTGLGLTPREAEVTRLLAEGCTNTHIGEALGISPRTTQKHLEHVFGKLGVRTRTAAALRARDVLR